MSTRKNQPAAQTPRQIVAAAEALVSHHAYGTQYRERIGRAWSALDTGDVEYALSLAKNVADAWADPAEVEASRKSMAAARASGIVPRYA